MRRCVMSFFSLYPKRADSHPGGTFTDSFSKGYDCILLSDGAGTTSPAFAQQCFDFNAAHTFGFATSCKALAEGVASMKS